jgi:hypothetical protein
MDGQKSAPSHDIRAKRDMWEDIKFSTNYAFGPWVQIRYIICKSGSDPLFTLDRRHSGGKPLFSEENPNELVSLRVGYITEKMYTLHGY